MHMKQQTKQVVNVFGQEESDPICDFWTATTGSAYMDTGRTR